MFEGFCHEVTVDELRCIERIKSVTPIAEIVVCGGGGGGSLSQNGDRDLMAGCN